MYEHYSDPLVSVWQSVLTEQARQSATAAHAPGDLRGLREALLPLVSDKLKATDDVLKRTQPSSVKSVAPLQPFHEMVGASVVNCAELYLERMRAWAIGTPEQRKDIDAHLAAYGQCDPGWYKAFKAFVAYYTRMEQADVPYRMWTNIGDNIEALPAKIRIGIIGDWGTGELRAQRVLESLKAQGIGMLIHLGDIYYAGTAPEAELFRTNVRKVFPDLPVRTLCGNHDMYSGADAYYQLITELGQPASFFGLRNDYWQILAADTGYNDYNLIKGVDGETWLREDTRADKKGSELAWHLDKLDTAGARKTVFLSHHPLFSRLFAIGGNVTNKRLFGQLGSRLPQIDLWLWGHEHVQAIYGFFQGLQRGRCIGASAIPNASDPDPYADDPRLAGEERPELLGGANGRLLFDHGRDLYELGYAVLALDGSDGEITYYAWGETRGARTMFAETIDRLAV